MAKINKCAKCGACTAPCPIYKISGKETLTARGRIHLTEKLGDQKPSAAYKEIFSRCLLCGACYKTCPRDINTPELIIEAREKGAVLGGLTNFKKLLLNKSLANPSLLGKTSTSLQSIQKAADQLLPADSGLRAKLALFQPSSNLHPSGFVQAQKVPPQVIDTKKVAYFPGCLANYLNQEIAAAALTCLKQICDTGVLSPFKQTCCGMAAGSSGSKEEARTLAKKNISAFNAPLYADLPIFTSCSTCYAHLKSYVKLFKNDKEWSKMAESFSERVCEFSSFILENITPGFTFKQRHGEKIKVFYHDPCHLRFPRSTTKEIIAEPRALISKITGIKIEELASGAHCCGQGGLFRIAHPDDSAKICDSLLSEILKTDSCCILTTCSGCLMQIKEGLAKTRPTLKAQHLAVFLTNHLNSPPENV